MIEWNTVKYIDCMDLDEGLPSLPDKSIDLCFTDPPWLNQYKGYDRRKKGLNPHVKTKPHNSGDIFVFICLNEAIFNEYIKKETLEEWIR